MHRHDNYFLASSCPVQCTYTGLQITGISGFLGYATLVSALESGYSVRGVVRKQAQVDTIKEILPAQFQSQLELITIPDLAADGAFDDAFKGVTYVIHVASPQSAPVSLAKTPC